jgi:hypothetical protein
MARDKTSLLVLVLTHNLFGHNQYRLCINAVLLFEVERNRTLPCYRANSESFIAHLVTITLVDITWM